jgi:hypothetical protein
MFELFRRGEVLPAGRTNEEEAKLVKTTQPQKGTENTKEKNNGDAVERIPTEKETTARTE